MTQNIKELYDLKSAPEEFPDLLSALVRHIKSLGEKDKVALEACYQICKFGSGRQSKESGNRSPVSQCLDGLILQPAKGFRKRADLPTEAIIRDIFRSVIGRWLTVKSDDAGTLKAEHSATNLNNYLEQHRAFLFEGPEAVTPKVRKTPSRKTGKRPSSSMEASSAGATDSISSARDTADTKDSNAPTNETAATAPGSLESTLQPDATSGLLESDASASKRQKQA
jgi:hypothetical protein